VASSRATGHLVRARRKRAKTATMRPNAPMLDASHSVPTQRWKRGEAISRTARTVRSTGATASSRIVRSSARASSDEKATEEPDGVVTAALSRRTFQATPLFRVGARTTTATRKGERTHPYPAPSGVAGADRRAGGPSSTAFSVEVATARASPSYNHPVRLNPVQREHAS
jgi:hypothetical protein